MHFLLCLYYTLLLLHLLCSLFLSFLQVLVNQNKGALNQKTDAGESNSFEVKESVIEFTNRPTYSKKIATKNIKALASYSTALLQALADLFIDSAPMKRSFLKVFL